VHRRTVINGERLKAACYEYIMINVGHKAYLAALRTLGLVMEDIN
jgi:hypothetical protein